VRVLPHGKIAFIELSAGVAWCSARGGAGVRGSSSRRNSTAQLMEYISFHRQQQKQQQLLTTAVYHSAAPVACFRGDLTPLHDALKFYHGLIIIIIIAYVIRLPTSSTLSTLLPS